MTATAPATAPATRLLRLTATRCYLGQGLLQVPAWCPPERMLGLVAQGGALARLLARTIAFDRLDGTGLARTHITAATAAMRGETVIPLDAIRDAMHRDGYRF
jgi:hypothetical protein